MGSGVRIYKRFDDVFKKGDKFKILETGEILIYQSSTGGANFSSYVEILIAGKILVTTGCMWLHEVVKVNDEGEVIDDFSQYKR